MAKYTFTVELDSEFLESTVNGRTYQMPIAEIAEAGKRAILNYGAQRIINDATGGSDFDKDKEPEAFAKDKHDRAQARLAKVMAGDFTVSRGGVSDPHAGYRKHLNSLLNTFLKKNDTAANKENRESAWEEMNEELQAKLIKVAKLRTKQDQETEAELF